MEVTAGTPGTIVAMVDGPVATDHPRLATDSVQVAQGHAGACMEHDAACVHGTFVAGVMAARRDAEVPGVCPGCTLLVRPIFAGGEARAGRPPRATPRELAAALLECIALGARAVNISAVLTELRSDDHGELSQVLDLAARRGVLVVVAAGNRRGIASSDLTRHPWVIPVVAYDRSGRPLSDATLGASIGMRGLGAPGEGFRGLAPGGRTLQLQGSSVAAPFVTGTAALLWSAFPSASAGEVKLALLSGSDGRRRRVTPALLNAWEAYRTMSSTERSRG